MDPESRADHQEARGVPPSHGISIEVRHADDGARPPMTKYMSSPAFHSPIRHHFRTPSTPRRVKTTLNARSEYSTSSDDGQWQHRINQYVVKQEIGRGSFGAVHLAVDQHGVEYAVKEFSKSRLRKRAQSNIHRLTPGARRRPGRLATGSRFDFPGHRSSATDIHDQEDGRDSLYLIQEEIAIMKKLNHPNLVALYEVLDDPAEDSLYMVLEMCKKGVVMKVGVEERADPYDDETCRHFFRDLILGIEYLHAQGVVHRDIKPDNCLLTHDDVLKVVDFGVSEMFQKESEMKTAKSAGSPAFLPPELCVAKHGEISGKAADIWSMGATLFCLRFGRIPFEKGGVLELYEAIRNDDVVYDPDTESDFVNLIKRILEKDPAKRIKMEGLREHPWVTRQGTDPLLSVEENTANLIEPPTEEEMNSAITGNFRNLLTVMKAVKKFKRLASRRKQFEGPGQIPGQILEESTRLVQPPMPMPTTHAGGGIVHRKARSVDTYDRRAIDQAMVTQGVHRNIIPGDFRHDDLRRRVEVAADVWRDHGTSVKDGEDGPRKEAGDKPPHDVPHHRRESGEHWKITHAAGKGQAHDFHEDQPLMLDVGPGDPEEGMAHIVSESPTAADINIYEAAYEAEVERIQQARGHEATVYPTRRLDGPVAGVRNKGPSDRDDDGGRPRVKWGHILDQINRSDDQHEDQGQAKSKWGSLLEKIKDAQTSPKE